MRAKHVRTLRERFNTAKSAMDQHLSQKPETRKLVAGDRAPDVTLADHQGQTVPFASLWQARPRVLLFVRHFG